MLAAGACILGVALSVFLLASIPTILALRRSAIAAESLLLSVAAEVPDTAATLRLSGMELADCIQEMGALSTDLTEGVRASARAVASAEAGIRQGAALAGKAVTQHVIPQVQDRVESALQERARLEYTREVLASTKSAAQRLRFALAASGLARGVAQSGRYLRRPGSNNGSGGGRRGGGASGGDDELLGA
ncbi:hypothetical protein ABPG75_008159 [Micractinium tetrahymenae]